MSLVMFNSSEPRRSGFVWLVGGGPGAADLITVRGQNILRTAEVLIYDDLANSDLRALCPDRCEMLYVGKRASRHSTTQEEINQLLVNHALAGRCVVRLKGGDPAIFGRLGEELEALRAANIPYEIVPGVTAACAAAAAAGVTLTRRGVASAAVLATGHECGGKEGPSLDWDALAQPGATLCVYMGTRRLAALADRLMDLGHKADTPLLIVSHASLPQQAIRYGTLEEAGVLAAEALGTPSLVLIGEIATLNKNPLAAGWTGQEVSHA